MHIQYPTDLTAPGAIDELIAYHRQTFGGWTMEANEDSDESNIEDQESEEGDGEQDSNEDGDDSDSSDDESSDDEGEDSLPEWAKSKIAKQGKENQSLRTRLRDAEARLADAKTPDDFEALRIELREERERSERDLLVENVALKFNLPEALAKRLSGKTREELEADARDLAQFITASEDEDDADDAPESLSGGLSPKKRGSNYESASPGDLAREFGRGRRKYAVTKG